LTDLGVTEVEPAAPPTVIAVGIQLQALDGTQLGGQAKSPEESAVLDGSLSNREDRPPVVLWAGPAPILRNFGWEGVIDIGLPGDVPDAPSSATRQLSDIALPTTQPEK
jgi:hypothetical protein